MLESRQHLVDQRNNLLESACIATVVCTWFLTSRTINNVQ